MNRMLKMFCGMAALALLSACSTSLSLIQPRNKEAAELFAQMDQAYNMGDCSLFHDLYAKFSAEKPSAKLREQAYYYAGMCYEMRGGADNAVAVYKVAMELYPKNPAFAYRLALIYSRSQFYEKSLPLFDIAISRHYQEKGALAGAAMANAALGRYPQAAKYYVRALSLSNDDSKNDAEDIRIIKELSLCLINSRRYEEAREYIEKGHELDSMPVWHVLAAKSYSEEGDFKKASEEISKAIAEDNLREYRLSKAFYDYWAGETKQAEAAADMELAVNGRDYLAAFLKGMILRSAGNKEKADSYFRISACGEDFVGQMSSRMSSVPLPPREELCK